MHLHTSKSFLHGQVTLNGLPIPYGRALADRGSEAIIKNAQVSANPFFYFIFFCFFFRKLIQH